VGPLGIPELILIFILALLIFGPQKLPELGRNLSKAIREFQRASHEFRSTVENEMHELERQANLKEARALADEIHSAAQLDSGESAVQPAAAGDAAGQSPEDPTVARELTPVSAAPDTPSIQPEAAHGDAKPS